MKITSQVEQPDWNSYYQEVPADEVEWELGGPSYELTQAVTNGYIVPPSRVLDIGCGLGTQSIYLAKQGFEVVGIDIAETALHKAKKLAQFANARVDFQIADVTSLPFATDSFDIMYDRGCFQHLPVQQQLRYRTEVARVLTDGGTLSMAVFAQAFSDRALEGFFYPIFSLVDEDIYTTTEKGTDKQITWRSLLFEKQQFQYLDVN